VAQRSDLPAGFYVTVKEVKPRSPAEKAGLQEFDIITHVDGHKIDHAKPLGQFIAAKDDGEQILIKFLRKGEEKEVTATLH
jgi:serine protease Do